MASRSAAQSESIAAFIPALELLITEAMDEWKIPGLTVAVVQNGEVALEGGPKPTSTKCRGTSASSGRNGHCTGIPPRGRLTPKRT